MPDREVSLLAVFRGNTWILFFPTGWAGECNYINGYPLTCYGIIIILYIGLLYMSCSSILGGYINALSWWVDFPLYVLTIGGYCGWLPCHLQLAYTDLLGKLQLLLPFSTCKWTHWIPESVDIRLKSVKTLQIYTVTTNDNYDDNYYDAQTIFCNFPWACTCC